MFIGGMTPNERLNREGGYTGWGYSAPSQLCDLGKLLNLSVFPWPQLQNDEL